jgi:hypothetical protein
MDDGGRGDLNLGGKEVIAGAESARAEDAARREWPPLSPHDEQQQYDDDRDYGGDHPGRVKVELRHVARKLSMSAEC